jgi:methylated-DNA-protein-cysteine methyltransferase related protein
MIEDNFFEKVYAIAREVPFGRVTTYGAIARCIGTAGSSRMVGWAMNKSFQQNEFVPAHRVVNRKGLLTGKNYFGGERTMEELLLSEGIPVVNNRIENFEKYFWDPFEELIKN